MVTKSVENLRAIEGDTNVEVNYLGSLLWFTVGVVLEIPADDLQQALDDFDLKKFMPREINPRDAFRRATKLVERKRDPYGTETYVNLLVREVRADSEKLVRQLVREVVDGENIRLEYKPVVHLEIQKDEQLTIKPLAQDLTAAEQATMDHIPEMYEKATQYYDGVHVGYIIKTILNSCNPVSVRPSGGVYFVPQKHADTIESLKELTKRLNNYSGQIQVWSVPVIDATEHREMIEESLEEQVISGSVSLIKEMKSIMEDPTKSPSKKLVQRYVNQVRKLKDQVSEYEEMLETQATKARENLELARLQTTKFMELTGGDE